MVDFPHDCCFAASRELILGVVAEFTKWGDDILVQTNEEWTTNTKEGVEEVFKSFYDDEHI